MSPTEEPTIELDDYAAEYLLLRAKRKELRQLTAEVEKLEKAFRQRVGDAHIAKIAGEDVISNRPYAGFQGKSFRADHPILAKTYTNIVEKEELDLLALQRDHPTVYAQYQSRQFRILEVE